MTTYSTRTILTAGAVFLAIATTPISAAETTYKEFGAGFYDIDLGLDFSVTQIEGVYGWRTSQYVFGDTPLSYELRGGFGVDDEGVELTYTIGGFVRQEFSQVGRITPYLLAGIAHVKAEANELGSDTDTGLSVGVGARYQFANGWDVRFEYLPQLTGDVSGFSIGVRF